MNLPTTSSIKKLTLCLRNTQVRRRWILSWSRQYEHLPLKDLFLCCLQNYVSVFPTTSLSPAS